MKKISDGCAGICIAAMVIGLCLVPVHELIGVGIALSGFLALVYSLFKIL